MSEKINLEQLAMFLKDTSKQRSERKRLKKKRKAKAKKEGKRKGEIIPFDIISATRSGIVNKLGIKENIVNPRQIAFEKLKKTAVEGSLNLIYALQKDVKDIQNRFMSGSGQPPQTPYKLRQQTQQQIGGDRFDSMIQAQKLASENKKNQDRIEKEAKAEAKRIEAEAKAEIKRLEKEAKDEQNKARAEQTAINNENIAKDKEVTRLLKVRGDRERKQLTLQQSGERKQLTLQQSGMSRVADYTIAQGMRTFADLAPNPPDIGGGGGLPPLPFDRVRDQYDPLEPTPFYRSTSDRIEAPVLSDVLGVEGVDMLPPPLPEDVDMPPPPLPVDVSMSDEALLGLSAGMVEETGDALPPPPTPPKKKGGRPIGSKNKPKQQLGSANL